MMQTARGSTQSAQGESAHGAAWVPPADVKEHSEREIGLERDFFHPPPPEIGKVESAYTSLKTTKTPWSAPARFALAGTIAAVFGYGVYLFAVLLMQGGRSSPPRDSDFLTATVSATFGALLAFGVVWFATRFKHRCDYVGDQGIARFTAKGSRDNVVKREILRFADAAELRTSQTRHYTNGVYTGTTYEFTWSDPQGFGKLRLKGQHRGKNKPPKPDDPFHFAVASEIAWSTYRLQQLPQELEEHGFLQFNTRPGEFVRVGPGFFEFCFKNEVQKITVDEIQSVNLAQGHFLIKSKDAKWFSRQGKFSFNYGQMANARLFLLAMAKLCGYRFS